MRSYERVLAAAGEFAAIFAPSCPAPFVLDSAGTGCWSEGNPFSGVQFSNYWSATTLAGTPIGAWLADLSGGGVNGVLKTFDRYVWPVRERH